MSDAAPVAPSPHSPLVHGPSGAEWQAAHDAMKANDKLWSSLAFDGIWHDGHGGLIENRRCPHCGTTLSRPISPEEARAVCERQTALSTFAAGAIADAAQVPVKKPRGFAALSPERHREIAVMGGRTAHQKGRAHRFTSEQARVAGRRGGQAVSADLQHMAEIGRQGGRARAAKRQRRPTE